MTTLHRIIDGLPSMGCREFVLGVMVVMVCHACCPTTFGASAGAPYEWKVGTASGVITPTEPMWMSGYAARNKPSEGKVHDLRAKVLAIQDTDGTQVVIITMDLLGISRAFRDGLEAEVGRCYGLPAERLLISTSHTHCGPVMRETRYSIYGDTLYGLSPEDVERCEKYVEGLQETLVQLVGQALKNLELARLSYSHARAGFAMNRRARVENGYQIRPNPDGPVDHDVPILRVDGPDGKLRAVLFGYACHCTTLSFYEFCGDYAGFAQEYIEAAHPDTVALFMAGCGGDQNPYPRGGPETLEYCKQHGRALANAVETALTPRARPVEGPIRAAIDAVTLDFATPPSREQLEQQAKSEANTLIGKNTHKTRRIRNRRIMANHPVVVIRIVSIARNRRRAAKPVSPGDPVRRSDNPGRRFSKRSRRPARVSARPVHNRRSG